MHMKKEKNNNIIECWNKGDALTALIATPLLLVAIIIILVVNITQNKDINIPLYIVLIVLVVLFGVYEFIDLRKKLIINFEESKLSFRSYFGKLTDYDLKNIKVVITENEKFVRYLSFYNNDELITKLTDYEFEKKAKENVSVLFPLLNKQAKDILSTIQLLSDMDIEADDYMLVEEHMELAFIYNEDYYVEIVQENTNYKITAYYLDENQKDDEEEKPVLEYEVLIADIEAEVKALILKLNELNK